MLFTAVVQGNVELVQTICARQDAPAPSFLVRAVASTKPAVYTVLQAAFPLPAEEWAAMMEFVFALTESDEEEGIAPFQQQWRTDPEYAYGHRCGAEEVWMFRGSAMKHIRLDPSIMQLPWLKAEVDARGTGKLWTQAYRRISTAEVLADVWVRRAHSLPIRQSAGVVCSVCASHYACSHAYVL